MYKEVFLVFFFKNTTLLFLNRLCKIAFSSEYGLFKSTPDHYIFPSPASELAHDNHLTLFEFLGKIVGKAIYEHILIDVPFAQFFISKLLGRKNFFNDLPSLDPQLYKNLLFLKNYQGNFEDLSLNFTVVNDEYDQQQEVEIIANGKNVEVNKDNKFNYIFRVAHYRLNLQIMQQSKAFLKGFNQLIPMSWLQMFNEKELALIIYGSDLDLNVDDMEANTAYAGGYANSSLVIRDFWSVVREMTPEQKRKLLKFITSSQRPPLLGFKDFNPPITIRKTDEVHKLPSASTCINLLKLPAYKNKQILKQMLITAIENCTTFELT